MPHPASSPRARTWPLQEAKARFSELFRLARRQGPQWVTRHGSEGVVVLAAEEYRRLLGKPRLWDLLRTSPLYGVALDLKRTRERGHPALDL